MSSGLARLQLMPAFAAALLSGKVLATEFEPAPPPNTVSGQPFPPQEETESAPAPPPRIEQVTSDEATPILGKDVKDVSGKDTYGKIVDVLVGNDGKPAAAIIDFGGFLGVGSRKVAVQWSALEFRPGNHDTPVVLHMERSQIAAAPEFRQSNESAQVAAPPATPPPEAQNAPDAALSGSSANSDSQQPTPAGNTPVPASPPSVGSLPQAGVPAAAATPPPSPGPPVSGAQAPAATPSDAAAPAPADPAPARNPPPTPDGKP